MTRGAGLTDAADASQGACAFWMNLQGGDGTNVRMLNSAGNKVIVQRQANNTVRVNLLDPASTPSLLVTTVTTYTVSSGWKHFAIYWDTNFSAGNKIGRIYVDGVNVGPGRNDAGGGAFSVDYTETNWGIGASVAGALKCNAQLAEFMLWFGADAPDWATGTFLSKVIAGGKAVDPGTDAALVTGAAPIIYHSVRSGGVATDFATNRGSGGNFSITGSLDLATGPNG